MTRQGVALTVFLGLVVLIAPWFGRDYAQFMQIAYIAAGLGVVILFLWIALGQRHALPRSMAAYQALIVGMFVGLLMYLFIQYFPVM